MGSNVTIYCLKNITDYFEFERLCHDLMSLEGYSSIEPLGGFSDKGRDAIHVSRSDETTIFAYSVREDWRAKLAEDASKISKHGHTCDQLVFVTTARFTAGERDEAVDFIRDECGWKLELYGVERLRILLDVQHPRVKEIHPQIFPPQLLTFQTRTDASAERDVKLVGARVRLDRRGPRLFRTGDMPVLRGTFWRLNDRSGLLWGSGFKPRIATYDGWETPIPLRIDVQHGDTPIERVAQDIFGLTKLNYNACRLGDAEPVTVGFSDDVGEILISNPRVPHRKPNFKFYI